MKKRKNQIFTLIRIIEVLYQDTQQIKYWNTSPHNHRDTYPYWPKNNDHKAASWQHSTNNEYALRSLVSMV